VTHPFRPEDAECHPPNRVPVVLVRAGTLVLGLGFYLVLGAVFLSCAVIDLSVWAWAALRRGTRLAPATPGGGRRRFP
jgi:hypothetical protein